MTISSSSLMRISYIAGRSVNKINFTDQDTFVRGRPHHSMKSRSRRKTCFSCGSESHLVKQCPEPVNYGRAAANRLLSMRLSDSTNAVHTVLAHLCSELDHNCNIDNSTNEANGTEDVRIFEERLVDDSHVQVEQVKAGSDPDLEQIETFSVDIDITLTSDDFWGACIDSGAQKPFIRQNQNKRLS